jgi:hypothetical protein
MRPTEEVYGNQSFKTLRDLGCVAVYEEHIKMLEKHKQHLVNTPVSYDIITRIGYIDYNAINKTEKDIRLFEGLIVQSQLQ